jgi:hypothetical protein
MSKSAYEIRLDVLKIAQEMLDKEIQVEMENTKTLKSMGHLKAIQLPKMYSEDDLKVRASSLYQFVASKNI